MKDNKIKIIGAREHNLKNIDIKINKDIEICIIGRLIWYKYGYKYGFVFKNGYNMILSFIWIRQYIYLYYIYI